jgi:hypothetical protein
MEATRHVTLVILRLLTLVLAALSLTMESAHVLELPQKLAYDLQMYTAVNGSLYRYFAIVGGMYQIGAIVCAGLLVLAVKGRHVAFRWTLAGAAALVLAFVIWLLVVAPVNSEVEEVYRTQAPHVPAVWERLRARWEFGHAAGFVVQLVGFAALVMSVLVETPRAAAP